MSKKHIARTIKERSRTEIANEEMKQELGLAHYEGRSFPGWNHHVSVVLTCYAFVAAERLRRISPSATWVRPLVRTVARPERHYADSFATPRIRSPTAIA